MTSKEFVVWMKGFMEACNDFTATPKQWDHIKEVLDEVDDNSNPIRINPLTGTTSISGSGTVEFTTNGSSICTTAVWNDKMGAWHYTNYPEGFGYYINSKKKENE
jgi:hypothetical protein